MTAVVPPAGTPSGAEPRQLGAGPFDELVADAAEVTRHLAELPQRRVLVIPEQAHGLVAGLDSYGD